MTSFTKSVYPWFICFIGIAFYCFNYILRSAPSVMQNELSQTFQLTAYQFGLLTAAYYWAYAPIQIPAGMIVDKFGVRFVLSLSSLMATVGLSVFIVAHSFWLIWLGRFLIGLGGAFAYISILKLASAWLPANRFAIIAGLTTAFGMLCGALTQKYLIAHLTVNYSHVLHPALWGGILLSFFIILFVKDKPPSVAMENAITMSMRQLFEALRTLFKNPQIWLLGIIGGLLYLPASVFLDAYGEQYLVTVYHITKEEAVTLLSLLFYGWIISAPLIGFFSDKIKRRCLPLTFIGALSGLLLCIAFYLPHLSLPWLYTVFFMTGLCCGTHPLNFALAKEMNPLKISATVAAVINMLSMSGGMIVQPLVGKLLDWHAAHTSGLQQFSSYSASDYTFALSVVPLGIALGTFLSLFLKETFCTSQVKETAMPLAFDDAQLIPATP